MIRRGEIYFVELDPTRGREQAGRRPVLVVSADAINRQPLVIVVVVGTDAAHLPRDYPTNVRLRASETGLPKDTVFLCFQLRSLDPRRFGALEDAELRPAGCVSADPMRRVEAALKLTLGM